MTAEEPRIGTPEREAWQNAKNRAASDLAELLAARAAKDMEYWADRFEARKHLVAASIPARDLFKPEAATAPPGG